VKIPTLADVFQARTRIRPYLQPTPLHTYPGLSDLVGTEVWVKHENHQPIGAFKVRGGINLVSQLTDVERRSGVVAASTGNHGQSIAYAARLFGVKATICVPEVANEAKIDSIRALGAEVSHHGENFAASCRHAENLRDERGYRFVHSGNEPLLIAGVGTETLEILESQPDVDVLIVPVGGGSGAAGAIVAGKAIKPDLEVIGVQAEAAPAIYRSWRERALVTVDTKTAAEGLANSEPFELPLEIMWGGLDDFILVSENELRAATRHMIEKTRNLVEGAGAAAFAAALKLTDRLAGKKVAVVCSGGNITVAQLRDLLS
jgi:threonine dehydratase